jgi:hypothetical protein
MHASTSWSSASSRTSAIERRLAASFAFAEAFAMAANIGTLAFTGVAAASSGSLAVFVTRRDGVSGCSSSTGSSNPMTDTDPKPV